MTGLTPHAVSRSLTVTGIGCLLTLVVASAGAADVRTISHGEPVDITAHLAEGKYTLVDFYADWCGPCKAIAPHIDRLANQHADRFAVRKVDVGNWNEVSRQYRITSIPHLKLYDREGRLISEGNAGPVLSTLDSRLGGGGGGGPDLDVGSGSSVLPFFAFVVVAVIASALLFSKGKRPADVEPFSAAAGVAPFPGAADAPADDDQARDAIWFAMLQGSLEGPFSIAQLEDLKQRKCLRDDARVRRRGDAAWSTLKDVL